MWGTSSTGLECSDPSDGHRLVWVHDSERCVPVGPVLSHTAASMPACLCSSKICPWYSSSDPRGYEFRSFWLLSEVVKIRLASSIASHMTPICYPRWTRGWSLMPTQQKCTFYRHIFIVSEFVRKNAHACEFVWLPTGRVDCLNVIIDFMQ